MVYRRSLFVIFARRGICNESTGITSPARLLLHRRWMAVVAVLAQAAPKKDFKVTAWSIYVGWMPLGLCGAGHRHRQKMGRQIRPYHRSEAVQRLRRIRQSIHRRLVRCGDHHQHGRTVDSRRRWCRHHRRGDGRLLQRQRCRHPEEQGRSRRHQGPEDQPGRVLGLALSACAGAGEQASRREGHQGRQHLRCRYGGGLQDA